MGQRGGDKRSARARAHAGSREIVKSNVAHTSVLGAAAQSLLTRKYNPKTLQLVLRAAANMPVISIVCQRAGISRFILRYWLEGSKKGRKGCGDPFDVVVDADSGMTERFHILFEDAILDGFDKMEEKAVRLATGTERELLTFQGRVQYKYDPDLLAFGLTGENAYLLDDNGEPIPETVPLLDPEMIRWMLARRRPDQYGNKMQVEHQLKGGVLVVGATKTTKELEAEYGSKTHEDTVDVEFEEVTRDD